MYRNSLNNDAPDLDMCIKQITFPRRFHIAAMLGKCRTVLQTPTPVTRSGFSPVELIILGPPPGCSLRRHSCRCSGNWSWGLDRARCSRYRRGVWGVNPRDTRGRLCSAEIGRQSTIFGRRIHPRRATIAPEGSRGRPKRIQRLGNRLPRLEPRRRLLPA